MEFLPRGTLLESRKIENYVGIPFIYNTQNDCYGLTRRIIKECLGIDLGDLKYSPLSELTILEEYLRSQTILKHSNFLRRGSILIFIIRKRRVHLGIGVSTTHFLHVTPNERSVITSFNQMWKERLHSIWEIK
ncbi:MAG: NlpC/P60 family protein [Candidatus Helarchaeota archaeon]